MPVIKRGSFGPRVRGLQFRLNTRLKPSPRLSVDGKFGPGTELAVLRFQRQKGLVVDGVVGPRTLAALATMPTAAEPPHLAKFVSQIGTLDEFVRHVAGLEAGRHSNQTVMQGLIDFAGTPTGARYLLVRGDTVGVIDFRHFFAAASEAYNSGLSRTQLGVGLGGNPGQTVLMGLGNELAQCFSETMAWKLNSCFSAEDLGSNRLGAGFGERVKVHEAERSGRKISELLASYITGLQPVGSEAVQSIKTAGRWDVALESLAALFAGIGDLLLPRAY